MTRRNGWDLLGALALLGAVGCETDAIRTVPRVDAVGTDVTGSDTGSQARYSCDAVAIDGTCREFTGSGWDQAAAEGACDNGTVVTGSCQEAGKLGGCEMATGSVTEETRYYYAGDYFSADDIAYLSTSCLGTWQAAGGGSTLGR